MREMGTRKMGCLTTRNGDGYILEGEWGQLHFTPRSSYVVDAAAIVGDRCTPNAGPGPETGTKEVYLSPIIIP